jgi:hypothetical protein
MDDNKKDFHSAPLRQRFKHREQLVTAIHVITTVPVVGVTGVASGKALVPTSPS